MNEIKSLEMKLDVGSFAEMHSVVKSVLGSKPLPTGNNSSTVLKSFLLCLPSDESFFLPRPSVNLRVDHSMEDSVEIVDGYLHLFPEQPPEEPWKWNLRRRKCDGRIGVLLLDVHLGSRPGRWTNPGGQMSEIPECGFRNVDSTLSQHQDIVDVWCKFCIEHGVGVVIDQKIVSEEISEHFLQRGILLLDRVGSSGAEKLEAGAGRFLAKKMLFFTLTESILFSSRSKYIVKSC